MSCENRNCDDEIKHVIDEKINVDVDVDVDKTKQLNNGFFIGMPVLSSGTMMISSQEYNAMQKEISELKAKLNNSDDIFASEIMFNKYKDKLEIYELAVLLIVLIFVYVFLRFISKLFPF